MKAHGDEENIKAPSFDLQYNTKKQKYVHRRGGNIWHKKLVGRIQDSCEE